MRIRSILLILGIVLTTAFVALNLEEFNRVSLLSLGFTSVQAPLAMVMLVGLAAAALIFLLFSAYAKSAYLIENRRTARELKAQRELARQGRHRALRFFALGAGDRCADGPVGWHNGLAAPGCL